MCAARAVARSHHTPIGARAYLDLGSRAWMRPLPSPLPPFRTADSRTAITQAQLLQQEWNQPPTPPVEPGCRPHSPAPLLLCSSLSEVLACRPLVPGRPPPRVLPVWRTDRVAELSMTRRRRRRRGGGGGRCRYSKIRDGSCRLSLLLHAVNQLSSSPRMRRWSAAFP